MIALGARTKPSQAKPWVVGGHEAESFQLVENRLKQTLTATTLPHSQRPLSWALSMFTGWVW